MSEKNSLTLFDQLSTEIFFEIFDYLSCNDIIFTFFHLNQRFKSIILQHLQFLNHFTTPTNNFSFWQTILPTINSQIECLTITSPDCSFSLDLFPNLKSLIISSSLPIYYDELALILKSEQFKKLNLFKIKSEIISKRDCHEIPVLQKVLNNENSLRIFESVSELYENFEYMNNLKNSVNLQSLSLKLLFLSCLLPILSYTPNLKYLNILLLRSFDISNQSNPNIDLSKIKLKNFSFALEKNEIAQSDFLFLTWFINQFSSSLIYLSLNLNETNIDRFQFDGFTLQQQFLKSMIQLKSFHFYAQLGRKPMDVEKLLSTFQTQFWFDHHWTFGIHETYLYTLPFHFDKLQGLIDFNQIKSSNSKILDSPKTWSHVKSINSIKSSTVSVNLIKQMKLKMPNLTSITFNNQLMNNLYTNDDERNQLDITLDSITTVHCEDEDLQTIKQWLINLFPNTKHLMLSYNAYSAPYSSNRMEFSQKLDEYSRERDYIYFSKIQYVKIKIFFKDEDEDNMYQRVLRIVKELLEMFQNLQSFIFHFHQLSEFPRIDPFTDLNKMIKMLNWEKISEKYEIKHIYNNLQFVRKKQLEGKKLVLLDLSVPKCLHLTTKMYRMLYSIYLQLLCPIKYRNKN